MQIIGEREVQVWDNVDEEEAGVDLERALGGGVGVEKGARVRIRARGVQGGLSAFSGEIGWGEEEE